MRIAYMMALLATCVLTPTAAGITIEAFIGRPFGVARAEIPVSRAPTDPALDPTAFAIRDRSGRALYPVFSTRPMLKLFRNFVRSPIFEGRETLNVWFLFAGDEPWELQIQTGVLHPVRIVPRLQPRRWEREIERWWSAYRQSARERIERADYPPLVEIYLTSMLQHRLRLPDAPGLLGKNRRTDVAQDTFFQLMGSEAPYWQEMHDGWQVPVDREARADLPVPAGICWRPSTDIADSAHVGEGRGEGEGEAIDIEPLAHHVPEEAFYLRFGNFDNYLWMRHLVADYGGDISRMVQLRGHDRQLNAKIEEQLGLKESMLARLLGGPVISDVALIGHDFFLRTGASVGILFEARSSLLLGQDLQRQRLAAMERHTAAGAKEEQVTIDGHDVSYISTPDNRMRSYYAVDGDYHLVTTSKRLVERFYAAGQGETPLAADAGFRDARRQVPLRRNDTIFVHLSRPFLRGLVSPQYQVELARRTRSIVEIEQLYLARLAANAEHLGITSAEQLAAAGLLPRRMPARADGSQLTERDGQLVDSLRGARGTFVPVPDMAIDGVTSTEADRYEQLVQFHERQWQQMDPLTVAVQRTESDLPQRDRVEILALMVPFEKEKYGRYASLLGPATDEVIGHSPDDLIFAQAVVQGGRFAPECHVHHLFFGLQDMSPRTDLARMRLLRALQIASAAPAYVGAWPKPGWLDQLPILRRVVPDVAGYARLPLGLWRYQRPDGFSVISFQREWLAHVAEQLHTDTAPSPAQVRVHVGDISASQLRDWTTELNYVRARQTSAGNARLMQTLSQQLHVPPIDALRAAEQLLDVKLICPLGGNYQLRQSSAGLEYWVSSRWQTHRPQTYESPLLTWFRGLEADVTLHEDRLKANIVLEIQRTEIIPPGT